MIETKDLTMYDEVPVTETEAKILEAYRNGASVSVTYYTDTDLSIDKAIDEIAKFGITGYTDLTNAEVSPPFISIGHENFEERLQVSAYLRVNAEYNK